MPAPFGPRELCRGLSRHRGRPIRLMPYPIEQPGPFGLWFSTDAADLIVYQSQTTRAHQEHIILHEIGHIIAGHEGEPVDPGEPAGRVRRRSSYHSRHEREAELIAMILHEWAWRAGPLGQPERGPDPRRAADPGQAAVLERMAEALTGGPG